MILTIIFASLAVLSLAITLWQLVVASRFPLHRRVADSNFFPAVTLLKPLKGGDAETAECLRSWLTQEYPSPVQILFGVASGHDPVCGVVRRLIAEHPNAQAELVICGESLGPNAKVSTLIQLQRLARHGISVVSDADVRAPRDLLINVVAPFPESDVGLVNCFYQLANPATLAMQWEAIATNADFWSQVLQSRSLKPLDFALGAVMAIRREPLQQIGGFAALVDFLADDYQLGNLIARNGGRIVLCPVTVECREGPMGWRRVWQHQLRWARTIRFCQPLPFFFSLLGNATLWPLLLWFFGAAPDRSLAALLNAQTLARYPLAAERIWRWESIFLITCALVRIMTALFLQKRLTRATGHFAYWWLVPIRDLLQALIWGLAFVGNRVTWRGERFRVLPGGKLTRI